MAAIPKFDEPNLQALSDILGDTSTGLTGSEIGRFLRECGFPDPIPEMTKRHRLFAALAAKQNSDGCANNILGFVTHVMNPVRHVGHRDYFEVERGKLNGVLAFSGLSLGEDGKLRAVTTARTLTEAEAVASALRKALVERKVHADVLKFCRAELVVDNYFHAVFEAAKALRRSYVRKPGWARTVPNWLMKLSAWGRPGCPRLTFNSLTTESERNEHSGLMNLIKVCSGAFRNTTAHAPKIHWNITE